jgi:hypothetical protein
MCPFCRGTMKLARVDGLSKSRTYQCLDCGEVEDGTEAGSYFEWLMSRPKSKRALLKGRA